MISYAHATVMPSSFPFFSPVNCKAITVDFSICRQCLSVLMLFANVFFPDLSMQSDNKGTCKVAKISFG